MPNLVVEWASPFYTFSRTKLGIPNHTVSEFIAAHGTASVNGKAVELRYHSDDDGRDHVAYGHIGFTHHSHSVKWANQFNKRSARLMATR